MTDFVAQPTETELYLASTPGDRIARRRRAIPKYRQDQDALAADVGVSRQQLSRWENDHARPTGENLNSLANALGVTPHWILYGGGIVEGVEGSDSFDFVSDERGNYNVVPVETSGLPLSEQIEELREWLPDEMTRRMSRKLTPRVWLGMLYALGAEEGWPRERLQRIHEAIVGYDQAEQGGKKGP